MYSRKVIAWVGVKYLIWSAVDGGVGILTLLQGFRSMISHSTADQNTEDMTFFVFAIEAREYPPFFRPFLLRPLREKQRRNLDGKV